MKGLTLFTVVVLTGTVGCVNVQPMGPMTKVLGDKPLFAPPKKNTKVPGEEMLAPAPKPTPPAELVHPQDVTREDPLTATRKLQSEFESDRKTMPKPSTTAEISIYKNGEKVQ